MRWSRCAVLSVLILSACGTSAPVAQAPARPTPSARTIAAPTANPTAAPAATYPPTTLSGLKALAKTGDGSQIHEFHSEGTGLPTCPEPKREVAVVPGLTGPTLAADLLAYFFAQGLNNDCGSLVLAYHDQSEAPGIFTAGRINLTITGSLHSVEVDAGIDASGNQQSFTVTY